MISWLRPAGVVATALLGMPGLGFAATDPRLPPEAGGPMPAEHAGGMPQLDFGNPLMIAQIVWMLIIFALLYYLMASYALPHVASILEERRRRIEDDLNAAHIGKAEADAAATAHREATARARAEAMAAVAGAVQRSQDEAQARADALNTHLAEQITAAEARIDAARNDAMGALRQVAGETAEALVRRLTGSADRAAVDAAVGRELAARGRA